MTTSTNVGHKRGTRAVESLPVAFADVLPRPGDYTLDFCMWLQANFDRLKDDHDLMSRVMPEGK